MSKIFTLSVLKCIRTSVADIVQLSREALSTVIQEQCVHVGPNIGQIGRGVSDPFRFQANCHWTEGFLTLAVNMTV